MRHFTKYPSNYVGAASETSGAAMRKKRRAFKESALQNAELVATDGDWEMWIPHSFEASVYLAGVGGKKAYWDTAYEGNGSYYFDYFTKDGPLYIFINKNNPEEKFQYHPATGPKYFFDFRDSKADIDAFMCEHPAFAEYFDYECEEDIDACGDINCSTSIEATKIASKYDGIRDVLGEDEWYYIEEYIMNGDGKYSLDDVLYTEDGWDNYSEWKFENFGKKSVFNSKQIREFMRTI